MQLWNGHRWFEYEHPDSFQAALNRPFGVIFIPQAGNEPFCLNCGAITKPECSCVETLSGVTLQRISGVETLSGATLQRISDGDVQDYVGLVRDGMHVLVEMPGEYAEEDQGAGLPGEKD